MTRLEPGAPRGYGARGSAALCDGEGPREDERLTWRELLGLAGVLVSAGGCPGR